MAISFIATSNAQQQSGPTLIWPHTCSGSDRIIIVPACYHLDAGGVATGATYDGVGMTELDSHSDAGKPEVRWFYLVNPATGSNNIVLSFTDGSTPIAQVGGAQSFAGVHQSVPFGAVAKEQQDGGETDCAVDVASNVGDMIICVLGTEVNAGNRTITIKGGGEVEDWNLEQDGGGIRDTLSGGAHKAGAASSTNIGFNLNLGVEWASMGVALKPAPAGGVANPKGPLGMPLRGPFGGPIN